MMRENPAPDCHCCQKADQDGEDADGRHEGYPGYISKGLQVPLRVVVMSTSKFDCLPIFSDKKDDEVGPLLKGVPLAQEALRKEFADKICDIIRMYFERSSFKNIS